jgi:hypothetical protein
MTDQGATAPLTPQQLERGLVDVRRSPRDAGTVSLIVRRPAVGAREVVSSAVLDPDLGLVGDGWSDRGSARMANGSADPEAQVTIMSARVAALLAGAADRWAIAGDQLFVDLDLSTGNLPPGTRLVVGEATLVVSATPHTGCVKFRDRFGSAALRFVSTPEGQGLRLRGVNTRVERGGTVRVGDVIHKA